MVLEVWELQKIYECLKQLLKKNSQTDLKSSKLCNEAVSFGVIHKLRWQDFGYFDHLLPFVNFFYGINVDKKWTFLDYLPNSSFKRSLWTAPMVKKYLISIYLQKENK